MARINHLLVQFNLTIRNDAAITVPVVSATTPPVSLNGVLITSVVVSTAMPHRANTTASDKAGIRLRSSFEYCLLQVFQYIIG